VKKARQNERLEHPLRFQSCPIRSVPLNNLLRSMNAHQTADDCFEVGPLNFSLAADGTICAKGI